MGAEGFGDLPGDAYYDFSGNGASVALPDDPFDGGDPARFPLGESMGGATATKWLLGHTQGVPTPGTQDNWCTAFLQRLADPERPWDEVFNPYITVDWLPIDLTVFSGEETITPAGGGPLPPVRFASRQKTGALVDVDGGGFANLSASPVRSFLSYDTTELQDSVEDTVSTAYFKYGLELDIDSTINVRPTTTASHFSTLGYLNSTFGLMGESGGTTVVAGMQGTPASMPAALYWADRPFTNPQELLAVPLSGPGQLMQEFTAPATTAASTSLYGANAASPYRHLPNFFQASASSTVLHPVAMFELMETPSPWSDAQDFVMPGDVQYNASASTPQQIAINEILRPLNAPYNRISRFTEPGRVNVNDVSEPNVWQGLMWGIMNSSSRNTLVGNPDTALPFWSVFKSSRTGYDLPVPVAQQGFVSAPNPYLHPEVPTQFARVFKSSFEAGMVPQLRTPGVLDSAAVATNNPAEVTLLRSVGANANASGNRPLFSTDTINNATPGTTTFPTTLPVGHPFLDNLPLSRLQNLTTTRSNVFSVRVTIAFFEYDSSTGLGREYGEDDGTTMRHRGFYVIDRSIPVAFQEGQDFNTDKCILVRRVLE